MKVGAKKIVFYRRFCPSGHMTQNGDPKENVIAERVNGILKDETFEKTFFNTSQSNSKTYAQSTHPAKHMAPNPANRILREEMFCNALLKYEL